MSVPPFTESGSFGDIKSERSDLMSATSTSPDRAARSTFYPAYNLFRHKEKPELCCAVFEDRAVPQFLHEQSWRFDQAVAGPEKAPPGFRIHAARQAARLMGFYLFQAVR